MSARQGLGEVGQEDAPGHSVDGEVVHGQQQPSLPVGSRVEPNGLHHGAVAGGEPGARGGALAHEGPAPFLLVEPGHVDSVEDVGGAWTGPLGDLQPPADRARSTGVACVVDVVDVEDHAEGVMVVQDCLQCALQPVEVGAGRGADQLGLTEVVDGPGEFGEPVVDRQER